MECKKCGANIADNAKFCGYCGGQIESIVSNENVQNIEQPVESSVNMIPKNNEDLGKTIVVDNLVQNEQLNNNQVPYSSKKSSKNFVPLLAVLLIVVVAVLFIFIFNKMGNNPVSVLEKAVLNLSEKSKNSGTITAKMTMEEESTGSIVISATSKYAKENDKYKLQLTLNKNMFMDEVNVFLALDKKNASIYSQSSIFDILGKTSSDVNKWLSYSINFEEEEINLDDVDKIKSVHLDDVLDKEHFVYIDKSDNLRHYQLIINKKLIQNIKTKLSKSDDEDVKKLVDSINIEEVDLSEPLKINLYINDKNEITKISFDLADLLEEEGISKAVFELEFSNLGTTNVTIPNEALNAKDNLLEYLQINNIYTDAINSAKERTVELVGNEIRLAHTSYLYYNAGEDTNNLCDYVNSKYIGNYYNIKTPCANNEVVLQNDGVDYKVVYNNGFITITSGTITKTIDLKN